MLQVESSVLEYLKESSDFLAVLYYTKGGKRDNSILAKMENIGIESVMKGSVDLFKPMSAVYGLHNAIT